MLELDAARAKILEKFSPLVGEQRELVDALGGVLADDVMSPINVPPFNASAMDGFALNSQNIRAEPKVESVRWKVTDTIKNGCSAADIKLNHLCAARIMTGGMLPPNADCVVPFEDTDARDSNDSQTITIFKKPQKGQYVRTVGSDTSKSEHVLGKGEIITPAVVGLCASLGFETLFVRRRPVVAILSTGDELASRGNPLQAGQIYDTNTPMLAAAITQFGGEVKLIGPAKDSPSDIFEALKQANDCDLIVSTGGVSVGDHDYIGDILRAKGKLIFWKVNLKPGRPTTFGTLNLNSRDIPFFGLPGNPVSALVGFHLFIRPVLRVMLGLPHGKLPECTATLDESVDNADKRAAYFRAKIYENGGDLRVTTKFNQSSGAIKSMAHANALVICPAGIDRIKAGEKVCVALLETTEHLFKVTQNEKS